MDFAVLDPALFATVLDPAILAFFFGLFVVAIGSNLDIPEPVTKFLSLYLLFAIGYKGGVSLAETGLTPAMGVALACAALMAFVIPALTYAALRASVPAYDAAAIAASYGSVSAVTFVAATSFLDAAGVAYGGHMTVALVLMESPAIIMAVFLAGLARRRMAEKTGAQAAAPPGVGAVLRQAFTDGAHLVLLGALAIGAITGAAHGEKAALSGFVGGDLFKGLLALFLLEMGVVVGRRLREARGLAPHLAGFALAAPPVFAALALGLAYVAGLSPGDAFLLAALSASASYIVAPAVVRYAIPEANPGRYFTMSLAVTFPFNVVIGLPLYFVAVTMVWPPG